MPPAMTAAGPATAAAASATATSVAAMAPPPPLAGRRRPRPQSALGIAHQQQHPQSNPIATAAASSPPSLIPNGDGANAATGNSAEDSGSGSWSGTVAPRRCFIGDAITTILPPMTEQDTTKAHANAPAGGRGDHGSEAPTIPMRTDGQYVRLMGRVVGIDNGSGIAVDDGDGDGDGGFGFVIEDGTASVHVVVSHAQDVESAADDHRQLLPSAAKRPRKLLGAASKIAAPACICTSDLELGALVDCVGYLSLVVHVPEMDEAEQDQNKNAVEDIVSMDGIDESNANDDDDNNGEELGPEETDEQQQGEEDANAKTIGTTEMKQDAIEVASSSAVEEQSSCTSPANANDKEELESIPADGPQQEGAHVDNDEPEEVEEADVAHPQQGATYRTVLTAVAVATVSHPDAESLRTLELILASSSTDSSDQAITSGENDGSSIQGIHMAGDLVSQIGAFQPRSQERWHSFPGGNDSDIHQTQTLPEAAYSICSNTAFRFIRSAAADGGISEEDLAIALGCTSGGGSGDSSQKSRVSSIVRRRSGGNSGRIKQQLGDTTQVMAVRQVLQELQAGGEIYKTRRGTYLPL